MKHFNNCLEEYNSLIKNLQNQYNSFKNISLETDLRQPEKCNIQKVVIFLTRAYIFQKNFHGFPVEKFPKKFYKIST